MKEAPPWREGIRRGAGGKEEKKVKRAKVDRAVEGGNWHKERVL